MKIDRKTQRKIDELRQLAALYPPDTRTRGQRLFDAFCQGITPRAEIVDAVAEIESKLARSEQLASARNIKAGSMSDAVTDTDKPKKDTRAPQPTNLTPETKCHHAAPP
jgi:hypothetical protein